MKTQHISKIIITTALSLILFTNLLTLTTKADLYLNDIPKDTDLDGLTDQGEIELFTTDPTNPDTDNDGFLDGTEVLMQTDPTDINNPSQPIIKTPENTETPWSWYIARASGIISYTLLYLLIMSGIGITTGYVFNLFGPIIAWRIHRTIGISLTAFIFLHLGTLHMDKYMNFSIADLLIPFVSDFKPTYLSMGIFGFYLFIIVTITSIILIIKKYKAWRLIHYLTFPMFTILFIHGVYIGTDTGTLPMQIIYWFTGTTAGLAFLYRIIKIPSLKSNLHK